MKRSSAANSKRKLVSKSESAGIIVRSKYFQTNTDENEITDNSSLKKLIPLNKSNESSDQNRTSSFQPLFTKKNLVHTLILGTHPSIKSLSENQYFGHPMNAFWWIAGDCLGFRRSDGVSKSNGRTYKFVCDLNYGLDDIVSYEKQVETLLSKGFALWDIVATCERKGSLDADIKHEAPNDIRGFCEVHTSIKRKLFSI